MRSTARIIDLSLASFSSSADSVLTSGGNRSAGLQVMRVSDSGSCSSSAGDSGAGVAPYSPFSKFVVSLVRVA